MLLDRSVEVQRLVETSTMRVAVVGWSGRGVALAALARDADGLAASAGLASLVAGGEDPRRGSRLRMVARSPAAAFTGDRVVDIGPAQLTALLLGLTAAAAGAAGGRWRGQRRGPPQAPADRR